MYSFKRISNETDLNLFREGYVHSFSERAKVAKRELKLEELKVSNYIYALYKNNKMVAGFILNYSPKRCLEEFSPTERKEIITNLGEDKVCELVAIWKCKKERSAITTLLMWTLIIFKTMTLGRPYIFGCNRSDKVGKTYYYQADYTVIPNPQSELTVFYYTRKQFMMTFFNSLFSFLKKKGIKTNKTISKIEKAVV
jgi:hypothetical protein